MVTAYNDIKAIRRTLRAYGFRSPESGATLSSAQVEEFRTEMDALISAQLSLETIQREVEAQEQAFAGDAPELVDALHRAQSYVNGVIDDWETFGVKIRADMDAGEVTHLESSRSSLRLPRSQALRPNLASHLMRRARSCCFIIWRGVECELRQARHRLNGKIRPRRAPRLKSRVHGQQPELIRRRASVVAGPWSGPPS
jgi:hypothetical protein